MEAIRVIMQLTVKYQPIGIQHGGEAAGLWLHRCWDWPCNDAAFTDNRE